jgi:hypothetical protein
MGKARGREGEGTEHRGQGQRERKAEKAERSGTRGTR